MKAIIPKGWMTKIFGGLLAGVSLPEALKVIQTAQETFQTGADSSASQPILGAVTMLIGSLGVIFGIVRRWWIK